MRKYDPLIANYSVRIREVIVVILLVLVVFVYAIPRYLEEVQTDTLIDDEELETYNIPPTEIVQKQKPPKPAIPVPEDDEFFEEEIEFADTDFDAWDDWDAPEVATGPNIKFIPFDTAPKQKPGMGIKIVYPEAAREMNITGTVHVQFFIDKKGNVTEAYVAKGIPGTGLDEAALDAVLRSKWYPAKQREKKVGVWQTVPVKFVLK